MTISISDVTVGWQIDRERSKRIASILDLDVSEVVLCRGSLWNRSLQKSEDYVLISTRNGGKVIRTVKLDEINAKESGNEA